MSIPAWITINKTNGTGNGNISINASPHTGRLSRNGIITITNQNGSKPNKTVNVIQNPKDEFASKVSVNPTTIPSTGGKVTFTIKSNAKSFELNIDETFPLTTSNVVAKIGSTNQTVSISTESTAIITLNNDPGALAEYTLVVEVSIPSYSLAYSRNIEFHINSDTGESVVEFDIIKQTGATSTLSVNPSSLTLVTAGTAQNIAVTSNDNWIVS